MRTSPGVSLGMAWSNVFHGDLGDLPGLESLPLGAIQYSLLREKRSLFSDFEARCARASGCATGREAQADGREAQKAIRRHIAKGRTQSFVINRSALITNSLATELV